MEKFSGPPVSESILGSQGPAMKQAIREFGGLALDAPASLGESLPNAYAEQKERDASARTDSYRVHGSGYYARSAAEDFYTEEFLGDVDLGYMG